VTELTRCFLALCAFAVCSSLPACAQTETLKVKVNLVNLAFTVRDAEGALVGDLTRDEIQVDEDAVPQKIAFFSHATDVPLTLGIIMDASGSQDHFSKKHQHDLELFLNQVLSPRDKAFLIGFGNHVRLVSPYTNSPATLLEHMDDYQHHDKAQFAEIGPREDRDLGTAFYDSIFYSVQEEMVGQTGRRALLVFSDGEDNSSSHNMMEAIEAAQAANVQVYTLRYTELNHGKPTARNRYGTSVMDRIARETGAEAIDAAATNPKVFFQRIAGELRYSYELAYYPTSPERDGTFRKIVIKTTRPGLTTRARTGYFSR
jgi:Ca-activated chloride channel family protein